MTEADIWRGALIDWTCSLAIVAGGSFLVACLL